jgi:hypothetical protein
LIPGGLFEVVVAVWLIIKGFQPTAYGGRAEEATPPTVHPAPAAI